MTLRRQLHMYVHMLEWKLEWKINGTVFSIYESSLDSFVLVTI